MNVFTKILRTPLVVELPEQDRHQSVLLMVEQIRERSRKLFGRSMHIRQVDAGSCNGCELEIGALNSPYYDLERFGLHFVASPRHADCLLVTGPVTRNMADPLRRSFVATPDPKIVVAVGDCAVDCGIFVGAYGVAGPVSSIVPVDVIVRGCPPTPQMVLAGLLAGMETRL
jgi:Ni,Fe-hydrogenase III small subunit